MILAILNKFLASITKSYDIYDIEKFVASITMKINLKNFVKKFGQKILIF